MRFVCWLAAIPLAAAMFDVNPSRLPDAVAGKAYTGGPLAIQGGSQCPRNVPTIRIAGGSLPAGMSLSAAGQFGGAPSEPGRYEFVVRVENGCGWSDLAMTLEVVAPPVVFANPAALEFRVAPGQAVPAASILVSATAPGVAYTVEGSAPWIKTRARSGRVPDKQSALTGDLVEVEFDTASLAPGWHRASIEIGGWRMGQPLSVPVRVEVVGAQAALGDRDPRVPRIVPPSGQAPAAAPTPVSHEAPPPPAANSPKPRPAAAPARLSRSAQLRSRYLASKATPQPKPQPPPAAAHDKPSPLGEAKHPAKPVPAQEASHAKPNEQPKHH